MHLPNFLLLSEIHISMTTSPECEKKRDVTSAIITVGRHDSREPKNEDDRGFGWFRVVATLSSCEKKSSVRLSLISGSSVYKNNNKWFCPS